ncbi:3-deoxy-D-manno-octulosonic-acid kinase [Catenovulum agarivorans DS-2]|uniref:3-deoxy-D-manno-octulosonic acid kinase n=1 Tax=Catenovulum agarivorans DS-2 TaxID=1328313 RepID=W7R0P6_9ALTE|nr:3-deoxy-D-manno-octulosonic acid kinase [Catenovulum agarivorans]EWH11190.1 3-deoxy-D-manno-octulosonic-acid kinase [Catenovulum agarivorans DS-2]
MPQLSTISNLTKHSGYLITPANSELPITDDWFDIQHWYQQDAVIGQSTGRNTTYFFQAQQHKYVLRHYYRGGMIGKIAKDGYFYVGLKKSRVYLEFEMLLQMQALGLPVPTPIAARLSRSLLHYRADIIMRLIDNADDLISILLKRPLTADEWQKIGQTIAKFHQHGVYHADLNIHNIMLDGNGAVWLIDFDRGEFKPQHKKWQHANLKRLLRSFEKEKGKYPHLSWHQHNWHTLRHAYQSQMGREK